MDFMRLLKSIEELLYELVSWVIFYPLTLWRIIRHPLATLAYAERELQQPEEQQFDDSVSPPILLLISLGLVHMLSRTVVENAPQLTGIFADERNLLAFRAIMFSMFPLLFSLIQLRVERVRVTRSIFKPIFYAQCYATVPFVLSITLGILFMSDQTDMASMLVGLGLMIAGLVWYGVVQALWLSMSSKLHIGWSVATVMMTLALAVPIVGIVGLLVGVASSDIVIPE